MSEATKRTIDVSMRKELLTAREREVLRLLAQGNTAKEIALLLKLSPKTVESHKFNLMRKLNVHNTAQLITIALQERIISVQKV